jgi:4-hydroxy-3-polyprenylbenzoate decarboxylase
MKKIVVGITGASGSLLAKKFIENLLKLNHEVNLILTDRGIQVFEYELDIKLNSFLESCKIFPGKLIHHDNNNMFSKLASGSSDFDALVVIPCSMGTLGKIANCIGDGLLVRTADVALKERRSLIVVARETPLSSIHLENMLRVTRAGGVVMPPMPSYYNKPETVSESADIFTGRLMRYLGIENNLHKSWGEEDE